MLVEGLLRLGGAGDTFWLFLISSQGTIVVGFSDRELAMLMCSYATGLYITFI